MHEMPSIMSVIPIHTTTASAPKIRGCESTPKAHIIVMMPRSKVHPAPGISIMFISSLTPMILMALNSTHKPSKIGSISSDTARLNMSMKPSMISTMPLAKIHTLPVMTCHVFMDNAKLLIPEAKIIMPMMDERMM